MYLLYVELAANSKTKNDMEKYNYYTNKMANSFDQYEYVVVDSDTSAKYLRQWAVDYQIKRMDGASVYYKAWFYLLALDVVIFDKLDRNKELEKKPWAIWLSDDAADWARSTTKQYYKNITDIAKKYYVPIIYQADDMIYEFKKLNLQVSKEPFLPKDGVSYYICHLESFLFVQPETLKVDPNNNTPLVLSNWPTLSEDLPNLQFKFQNNQLIHVKTGKFTHPFGGIARNDVSLVLYDGDGFDRTSVSVTLENKHTFLKHDNFYVHPLGRSSNLAVNTKLAINTKLVYHTNYQPLSAIGFIEVNQ